MKKFLRYLILVVGLMAGLLVFCLVSLPDGKLHVFVLDIGQGDSILIQTPTNEHILIDGGPDDKVMEQMAKFMPFYEKSIDLVILSHPHADHVNGLVEVLKRYQVKQVMMTGVSYYYSGYLGFLDEISQQKIPVIFAGNGNDYQLGSIFLDMIYPFHSLQGDAFENQNNSSIVLRILYGQRSFYFSGDLEMEKELELVKSNLNLHADFLKAGHHGSKTSNTEPLLDRIKPLYAAISCGVNNKFHHPFPGTIEHLQKRNVHIYRTDLDGSVEALSDGENLLMKTYGK